MKKKNNFYKPTAAEARAVEHAGMAAAWRELQKLNEVSLSMQQMTLVCLLAFKAAKVAVQEEEKRLLEAHPGKTSITTYVEYTGLVCSAFMGVDIVDPKEISPYSIAGNNLAAMIQAAKALESLSALHMALDDDSTIIGDYLGGEAVVIAESIMEAD